jgi:hypothetical protein
MEVTMMGRRVDGAVALQGGLEALEEGLQLAMQHVRKLRTCRRLLLRLGGDQDGGVGVEHAPGQQDLLGEHVPGALGEGDETALRAREDRRAAMRVRATLSALRGGGEVVRPAFRGVDDVLARWVRSCEVELEDRLRELSGVCAEDAAMEAEAVAARLLALAVEARMSVRRRVVRG